MKITFCGASGLVTGSCYLLEFGSTKLLVDCGMFQGSKDTTRLNYQPFPFTPSEISYLFLTHAHIDHCGLIPKLVKEGFKGKIFATAPTIDLAKVMLQDTAHVNEQDTHDENKRRQTQGLTPRDPLYTLNDVKNVFPLFSPVEYANPSKVCPSIIVTYRNAGHILGSSTIELDLTEPGKTRKIVFSGDLGPSNTPIVDGPSLVPDADYVLIESTYGDHPHADISERESLLYQQVKETFDSGGRLLIPSFSVERTQEILYYLHRIIKENRFPNEQIYLDSPLAIEATQVFSKYLNQFPAKLKDEFHDPFHFAQLHFTKSPQESKTLNATSNPCIIIAGNGMCTSGRIRYHLQFNLSKPEATILFVGYQAEGTLGRVLCEGAKEVRMMGSTFEVHAKIAKLDSFSSHADANDLIRWLNGFKAKPKTVFIVHGEEQSSAGFGAQLNSLGFQTHLPKLGETVELD